MPRSNEHGCQRGRPAERAECATLTGRVGTAEGDAAECRTLVRAIADDAYDLIVEMDENLRVLDLGPGCHRILGMEPEALIGGDGLAVVHPEDRSSALEAVSESLASGRSRSRLLRFVRPGGEALQTEAVSVSYRDADGATRVLVCCRDVRKRERLDPWLRESEERLIRVFHSSPVALLVTRLEDGCVLEVNRSFLVMMGCKREDVLGTGAGAREMWVRPEDRGAAIAWLESGGSVRAFRSVFRDANGRLLHGLASADVIEYDGDRCIVWQSVDVTDQRAVEDALRASEARYRSLIEHSPLGVAVIDRDLVIREANAALAGLVGAPSAAELLGRDLTTMPIYRVPGLRDALQRALVEGEGSEADILATSGWGKAMEIRARIAAFRDTDGRILGVQALAENVGERNRLERSLYQSEKIEAVGQVAAGVAHEFGNCLSVIATYADLIRRSPEPQQASRRAGKIEDAALEGIKLVAQLQKFAENGDAGARRAADLNASVRALDDLIRGLTRNAIQVGMRLSPVPICVRVDTAQLDRVLLNLVLNARDAMPDGGALTLRTGETHVAGCAGSDGFALPDGDYAVLSVRDTGGGMDSATQARIFDEFFTTKPAGQGTGLGLALVRRTVRASGGDVRVTSSPGGGATFEVFLPIASGVPGVVTEPSSPPESRSAPDSPSS